MFRAREMFRKTLSMSPTRAMFPARNRNKMSYNSRVARDQGPKYDSKLGLLLCTWLMLQIPLLALFFLCLISAHDGEVGTYVSMPTLDHHHSHLPSQLYPRITAPYFFIILLSQYYIGIFLSFFDFLKQKSSITVQDRPEP